MIRRVLPNGRNPHGTLILLFASLAISNSEPQGTVLEQSSLLTLKPDSQTCVFCIDSTTLTPNLRSLHYRRWYLGVEVW